MQPQFANLPRVRSNWRMGVLALLVAWLAWLAAPQPVLAATFVVTKTTDTNDGACDTDCSLREAIIAANATSGIDVITLPAGTYTLSRLGVDNTAANGDLDVTAPLIINGAAQATTIIQAGSSGPAAIDRIFSFNPLGTPTGFLVSLNDLTIRNGKNPNAFATQENNGGCFDFDAGTTVLGNLSLTNVAVSNCETTDGDGGGVAIFLPKGGTVNFSGVTIQNNIASRGGTNSGNGGGLWFGCVQAGGTANITIANTTISGNSTRSLGGGTTGSGGGILFFAVCTPGTATADMQLRAVTINGNSAINDGGGIYSGGNLTIDNNGGPSVISNNSAGRSGGGLWLNHSNRTSTISKVTFSGNSAGDAGGAIRLDGATPGNNLTVSFSRFVNNTAASGKASAISVYNGNATVTNNWWGCSTGPSAAPCDTAKLDPASGTTGSLGTGTLDFTPWLRLNLTAATNPLVTGQSTGLTASFLTDSNGGAVALSNLTVLLGLPVTWSSVGGTLSGQQTTIQTAGTATANYQATAAAAGNRAVAKVDNDGTTTGSNVLAITVNKANTTATITADTPDPAGVGQSFTVNYNITANTPGAGTPSGTVTVSDGVNSCTGTVAAGTCNLTLTTIGARTLTATYAGDANYNSSTSAGVAHTVSTAATTTAITADNPDPSVVGQPVVVQYTVTPQGTGTPTGNVTVSDGTISCPATVAAGQCSLTFTSAGAKSLTAAYNGDANFSSSISSVAAHTVNKAATTTTITADTPDPSVVGQAVTVNYNVTVNAPGAGTPSGNVTVSDGVDSCTGTVAAGSCSLSLTTAGARTLTATYSGDSNFNASTSTGAAHTATPIPPEIAVTGQQQPIVSGSTTPSPNNGTAFGDVIVGSAVTHTFTISNSGAGLLTLSGAPLVAVSGANAADFAVVTLPAASVAAGGHTSFQVRFTPSAAGVRTATVTIANNDSDENPYTFAVQGQGAASINSSVTQVSVTAGAYNVTPVACGAAGNLATQTITLTLHNNTTTTFTNLFFKVKTLEYKVTPPSGDQPKLCNADTLGGGVGATLTLASTLAANSDLTPPPVFVVGLPVRTTYRFFVDLYSIASASSPTGLTPASAYLGSFVYEFDPDSEGLNSQNTLFLPLIYK